jgi:hypothetical protein
VAPRSVRPSPQEGSGREVRLSCRCRAIQAPIREGYWRADPQAKAWAGHAVGDVLGLDMQDKHNRAKVKIMLATWIKNGVLRRENSADPVRRTQHPTIVVGAAA